MTAPCAPSADLDELAAELEAPIPARIGPDAPHCDSPRERLTLRFRLVLAAALLFYAGHTFGPMLWRLL
jgi:hypothetical protein